MFGLTVARAGGGEPCPVACMGTAGGAQRRTPRRPLPVQEGLGGECLALCAAKRYRAPGNCHAIGCELAVACKRLRRLVGRLQINTRSRYVHLAWAMFEKAESETENARKLLQRGQQLNPNDAAILQVRN